jgi:hypothetical protein
MECVSVFVQRCHVAGEIPCGSCPCTIENIRGLQIHRGKLQKGKKKTLIIFKSKILLKRSTRRLLLLPPPTTILTSSRVSLAGNFWIGAKVPGKIIFIEFVIIILAGERGSHMLKVKM